MIICRLQSRFIIKSKVRSLKKDEKKNICPVWDLNPGPIKYEQKALPTELPRHSYYYKA